MKILPRIHSLLLVILSACPLSAATIITTYDDTQQDGSQLNIGGNTGKALAFTMPSDGLSYQLDNIELRLFIPSDISLTDISVSLWSNGAGNSPDTELLNFTNPTFTSGTTATFSFTPDSSYTLDSSTSYWLTLENFGTEVVHWRASSSGTYFDSPIGATSGAGANTGFYGFGAPSTWANTSSLLNSYTVNASVVPEPSTYAGMLGCLVALLAVYRRKHD